MRTLRDHTAKRARCAYHKFLEAVHLQALSRQLVGRDPETPNAPARPWPQTWRPPPI